MGRRDYLSRLALGRSPYEELEKVAEEDETPLRTTTAPEVQTNGIAAAVGDHVQQYDAKGRPVKPATEARNAEMRRAQNSVLELVGVVERRESSERLNDMKLRNIGEARQSVLAAEHENGEGLESAIALVLLPLGTWWSDCLTERCMTGLYAAERPFAQIISGMWQKLCTGGAKSFYSVLLPGAFAHVVYIASHLCLEALLEDAVRRGSRRLLRRRLRPKSQKRWLYALEIFETGLFLAVDAAMLPLVYYATAQQAGIAPAFPVLPPLSYHLPWHPVSFHAFGWKPIMGLSLVRNVGSPAALLLGQMVLSTESEDGSLVSNEMTALRRPILDRSPNSSKLHLLRDPVGWTLLQTFKLRTKVLEWCGWNITPAPGSQQSGVKHEVDVSVANDEGVNVNVRRHRSTALARLPAHFLAAHIDQLLERFIMLPLEFLTLRAVALSYMSSSLPKTLDALCAARTSPGPLSIWPTGAWFSLPMVTKLAYQASKLGLALTLRVCVGAVLCAGVTKSICCIGQRSYDWGSRSHIGDVAYEGAVSPPSRSADYR